MSQPKFSVGQEVALISRRFFRGQSIIAFQAVIKHALPSFGKHIYILENVVGVDDSGVLVTYSEIDAAVEEYELAAPPTGWRLVKMFESIPSGSKRTDAGGKWFNGYVSPGTRYTNMKWPFCTRIEWLDQIEEQEQDNGA